MSLNGGSSGVNSYRGKRPFFIGELDDGFRSGRITGVPSGADIRTGVDLAS
jgi:hypothetical protein